MTGVIDLTRHLLFIAESNSIPEIKLKKTGFNKVVFVAFSECYKHGLPVNYDSLFKKGMYGVNSDSIDKVSGGRFDRNVNYKFAKKDEYLIRNEDLNKVFLSLLHNESENIFSLVPKIVNSEIFKETFVKNDNENKSIFDKVILLPMDSEKIWTLYEILRFAEISNRVISEYDLRLPVKKEIFHSVKKFIELDKLNDIQAKAEFSVKDLQNIRYISEDMFDSIRVHGVKMEDEENEEYY